MTTQMSLGWVGASQSYSISTRRGGGDGGGGGGGGGGVGGGGRSESQVEGNRRVLGLI